MKYQIRDFSLNLSIRVKGLLRLHNLFISLTPLTHKWWKKFLLFPPFNFQINAARRLLQVILLVFPLFYFSISTDPPINQCLDQTSQETEIYISSGAMIIGGAHIYHARIVEESAPIEKHITKKAVSSKIDKPSALASVSKKSKSKIVLKPSKPKFVFSGSTPDQNFGSGTTLTNKNSVINPTFVERNDILCHFSVLNVTLVCLFTEHLYC